LPIYIPKPEEVEKYSLYQKIEEMVKQIILLRKKDNNSKDAEFLEKKIDELVETIYSI